MKAGEPVRSRHTSVVSSGPSVLRSTLHEAPKAQLSPGIYEDASARRTPGSYASTAPRGSPMMSRAPDGVFLPCPCLTSVLCCPPPPAARSPVLAPGGRKRRRWCLMLGLWKAGCHIKIGVIVGEMPNVLTQCRVWWSPEVLEQVMLRVDFQLTREVFWKSVWTPGSWAPSAVGLNI